MKKNLLIAFVIGVLLLALVMGCKQDPDPEQTPAKPWDTATVSFVALAASYPATTIDFSPSAALPAGVTYILTDNKGNSWNSASGFNGKVNVSTYSIASPLTFIQNFYLNGTEITGTGSKRTVVIPFDDFPSKQFMVPTSDSGPVTLVHP
jgi:cytochrome bd-type quinol oxidase subunit 2